MAFSVWEFGCPRVRCAMPSASVHTSNAHLERVVDRVEARWHAARACCQVAHDCVALNKDAASCLQIRQLAQRILGELRLTAVLPLMNEQEPCVEEAAAGERVEQQERTARLRQSIDWAC